MLEELDRMDYRRLMLALAADEILDTESRRLLLVNGTVEELTDAEMERIAHYDELIGVLPA